jgi:hypothetical protein
MKVGSNSNSLYFGRRGGGRLVWNSTGTQTFLTENFPQSLQGNARIVPQIRKLEHLSATFPIHYSLIMLVTDSDALNYKQIK